MLQIGRQLSDASDGVLEGPRVFICDRDRKWSSAVRELLETSGVRVIQTPFRAPNCNAHAERFVRSIKEECLNRVIPLGERHVRRTLTEFVVHYHRERNHQGLSNDLIDGVGNEPPCGPVRRRQRVRGLLSYYHWAALRRTRRHAAIGFDRRDYRTLRVHGELAPDRGLPAGSGCEDEGGPSGPEPRASHASGRARDCGLETAGPSSDIRGIRVRIGSRRRHDPVRGHLPYSIGPGTARRPPRGVP
jgi:hypothetical protein